MRRLRTPGALLAGLALALSALLACAGPALAAPRWLPATDLSAPLRDANGARVAMDDAGHTVVVWQRQEMSSPSPNVQASTREPGGSFSAPVELSSHAQDPVVQMTPGGEAIAAWWHFQNPPGVYVLEASARQPGGSFSPPKQVAALPAGVQASPIQLALDSSGAAVLAWTSRDPGGGFPKATFIEAAVRPPGGVFSEPETLSLEPEFESEAASAPSVAIDAAGEAVVGWQLFEVKEKVEVEPGKFEEPGEFFVEAAHRPAGGEFSAPQRLSKEGDGAVSPAVATDSTGNAIAVWVRRAGTESIVEAANRPSGASFLSPEGISAAGDEAFAPEVAMTPTGAATAIWTQVGESGRSIEAAMRAPGGEFGAPAPISSEGEEPLFPAIAVDADGNAVVSWSGSGEGGERARAVTRVGSGAFSAPAGISEAQGECCFHPDVAIDREGNATVVWNGFNGANKITRAAGYDADPPELRSLSVPATGTVGVPVTFSAQPFDVWPIVSTGFDFGDGTSAPGASVTHAYSSPGTFRVTATAADSAGSSTSASGTITIVPSNAFRLAKLKRNKKAGTATLIVDVPGPGRLTLSGKGVKRATASARRAGSVKLPVKPSRRTLKRLKARGKAKVKVTVTFSPDGGTPASQHRAIQLIERASGRRRGRRGPASGN